jgi:parvulin-like peptidyl-prolyl isomerase
MSDTFQLDPSPEEWLTNVRIDNLRAELGDAVSLMSQAGVLQKVLSYWIRRELGETEDDPSASISWARSQWEHRLDNLFLQRKDSLDEVSCRILRVKNQGLALELYHRLKAKESTFDQLSMQFGIGPEKFNGGLYKQQPLVNLPGNLGRFLRKLKPGDIAKPIKIGKIFVVVQLNTYIPAEHGETTARKLLDLELEHWLNGMTTHLESLLSSSTKQELL